uniref:Uncharacterized protein n=1 Tax=Knipowitschia caucasica TaxID=637954 RepID=A0AAV2MJ17_KNICA
MSGAKGFHIEHPHVSYETALSACLYAFTSAPSPPHFPPMCYSGKNGALVGVSTVKVRRLRIGLGLTLITTGTVRLLIIGGLQESVCNEGAQLSSGTQTHARIPTQMPRHFILAPMHLLTPVLMQELHSGTQRRALGAPHAAVGLTFCLCFFCSSHARTDAHLPPTPSDAAHHTDLRTSLPTDTANTAQTSQRCPLLAVHSDQTHAMDQSSVFEVICSREGSSAAGQPGHKTERAMSRAKQMS